MLKYHLNMFRYTQKYTDSDKRIQNNNLLYKLHQQYQNTFEIFIFVNFENQKDQTSFYYIYKFYNPYFVKFEDFGNCICFVYFPN